MSDPGKINKVTKGRQQLTLAFVVVVVFATWMIVVFASRYSSKSKVSSNSAFSGVVDPQFSEEDAESAMTSQQLELESLKSEVKALNQSIQSMQKNAHAETSLLTAQLSQEIAKVKQEAENKRSHLKDKPKLAQNETFFPGELMVSQPGSDLTHPTKYLNKTS